MLSLFIITSTLIYRSRGSRWHNTLRAYTSLGYMSAVNNYLKLKPDESKWYYAALQAVNTSFFNHADQALNKPDFEFNKSEERPLYFESRSPPEADAT